MIYFESSLELQNWHLDQMIITYVYVLKWQAGNSYMWLSQHILVWLEIYICLTYPLVKELSTSSVSHCISCHFMTSWKTLPFDNFTYLKYWFIAHHLYKKPCHLPSKLEIILLSYLGLSLVFYLITLEHQNIEKYPFLIAHWN